MASLSAQEIVDLIVHHRAIHGQKQRTRVDYFERTIAKALSQNPESPSPAQPSESAAGAPTPLADQPQPQQDATPAKEMSPERIRAELCAKISAAMAIPIQITRLVQITGKDPSYRMELADGTKIEFSNTAKFVDQEFVRLAIAGQKKWLMAPMKPARWREIAQDMLQACFDEDGPIEAQWEEGARDMVAKYLEQNGFIDDIASAHPDFRGKPIVKDARVAINTTDLHSWINKTGFPQFLRKGTRVHARRHGRHTVSHARSEVPRAEQMVAPARPFQTAGATEGSTGRTQRCNRITTPQARSRKSASATMKPRPNIGSSALPELARQPASPGKFSGR